MPAACQPAEFTFDPSDGLHWPQINCAIWEQEQTEYGPSPVIRAPRLIEMIMLWAIVKQYMNIKSSYRLYISITLYRSMPRAFQKQRGDYRARISIGYVTGRALHHDLNRLHEDIELTWTQIKELYRV